MKTTTFTDEDIRAIEDSQFSVDLVQEYIDNYGFDDIDDTLGEMEDRYHGCFESYSDYARNYLVQYGNEIPEYIQNYIDYERMANDFEQAGDVTVFEISNELYFFGGC
jgi:hypothetical protein